MKSEIEKKLNEAVNDITPDIFEKIAAVSVERGREREMMLPEQKPNKERLKRAGAILCACAACCMIFFGVRFRELNKVDSIIQIDVNPSVELSTNKEEKVLSARALNEDGEKVLKNMNLKNVDLDVAMNAVIGAMVKEGYLTNKKNSMLITVENESDQKAERLQKTLMLDMKQSLTKQKVKVEVYNQKTTKSKKADNLAKKYGISPGKAAFLQKLIQLDSSLTMEILAPMSIQEIAVIIKEHGIDINSIPDVSLYKAYLDSVKEELNKSAYSSPAPLPNPLPTEEPEPVLPTDNPEKQSPAPSVETDPVQPPQEPGQNNQDGSSDTNQGNTAGENKTDKEEQLTDSGAGK